MEIARQIFSIFFTLFNNMAVTILTAYVFSRTKLYENIIDKKFTFKNSLLFIAIMGGLSIYGTLAGIKVFGVIANTRNLGPAMAGLLGGPVIGFLVGMIGGTHRFLLGGWSATPCAIAAVVVGVASGAIFILNKGRFIGVKKAVILGISIEIFHSLLVVIMGDKPLEQKLMDEAYTTFPRVIALGMGMGAFSYITDNLVKERKNQEEKKRIEGELRAATDIQESMLPRIFPAFPNRKEFEIFASMDPAREVGGDLYDFFLIGEDKLCFLIGDVSGKGVPASLFMAISKTLFKSEALRGLNPDDILSQVNNTLSPDNDSNMFVTVICMILDLKSGEVIYSNAGHNPPLIYSDGDDFEFLKVPKGFVVGPMPDMLYMSKNFTVKPNDIIFMYTDGVTEAMNLASEQYTEERLKQCLTKLKGKGVEDLINGVKDDVLSFVQGAEQSDDITMLALKFNG